MTDEPTPRVKREVTTEEWAANAERILSERREAHWIDHSKPTNNVGDDDD